MATYLVQVSYTSETWAKLIQNPQDRSKAVGAVVKKMGGKVIGWWMAFGDADIIGVMEMPDNITAAGLSMAIAAGGACKSVKFTPLLSIADGMEAMAKAGGSPYKPPSGA